VGEATLENPLPWDTIPSATFEPVNRVAPFLNDLKERSASRLSTNRDFAYIREDIEQIKKAQADKTVSLNEALRLKEKAEAEARVEARKKEIQSRPSPRETVYEITLDLADAPGLPPPMGTTNEVKTATAASPLGAAASSSPKTAAAPAGHPKKSPDDPAAEATADDSPPAIDSLLDESRQILVDLIRLSARQTQVTLKGQPAPSPQ
jgi:carboxyl-terminal processing protease